MQVRRPIRSFVLRAGRVTAAQERALKMLWPVFGLDFRGTAIDLDAAFARAAPRCLEIGFGAGEVIGALAEANPHIDYLGVEVHRSGVGRLLLRAEQAKLANLRVICHDVVDVLSSAIAHQSFDSILIFFPDPWHKKRHHKRRLIDARFVEMLADTLRTPNKCSRCATAARGCVRKVPTAASCRARSFVRRPDLKGAAPVSATACGI
jgi:tRNA (guanine-N7-)-methyltransferase